MRSSSAAERIRRFNERLTPLFVGRASELELAAVLHDHVDHLLRHAALRWRDLPDRQRLIVLDHAVIDFLSEGGLVVGRRLHDGVIRPESRPMDLQFPCWGWRWLMGAAADWCASPHSTLFTPARTNRRVARLAWRLLRRDTLRYPLDSLRIDVQHAIDEELARISDRQRIITRLRRWPLPGTDTTWLSSSLVDVVDRNLPALDRLIPRGDWILAQYVELCALQEKEACADPFAMVTAALRRRGVSKHSLHLLDKPELGDAVHDCLHADRPAAIGIVDATAVVLRVAELLPAARTLSPDFVHELLPLLTWSGASSWGSDDLLWKFAQYVMSPSRDKKSPLRLRFAMEAEGVGDAAAELSGKAYDLS